MLQDYERLDIGTFKHRPTIEDEHLVVVPQSPQIDIIADDDSAACVQAVIRRNADVQIGEAYGTWLKVTNSATGPWRGSAAVRVHFRVELMKIQVAHMYSFTLLPQRYKPVPDDLKIEPLPSRPAQAELLPANEFELPSTFAVYDEWKPHAYGASWLSSRRGIRISRDSTLIVGFRASDENYAARLSTQSFFGGVVLAITASALTTAAFALFASSISPLALMVTTILLAVLMLAAIGLGYRALTRSR